MTSITVFWSIGGWYDCKPTCPWTSCSEHCNISSRSMSAFIGKLQETVSNSPYSWFNVADLRLQTIIDQLLVMPSDGTLLKKYTDVIKAAELYLSMFPVRVSMIESLRVITDGKLYDRFYSDIFVSR